MKKDINSDTTVTLEFESFDIEAEDSCIYDYVAVYDGHNASDAFLLLKACGRTLPPAVVSYDNLMVVQFHSDPFTAHSVSVTFFFLYLLGFCSFNQGICFSVPNYELKLIDM